MIHDTTLSDSSFGERATSTPPQTLGLVIVWSAEPGECGRVVLIPPLPVGRTHLFGRGEAVPTDQYPRLLPEEDRPGGSRRAVPIASLKISRAQLSLEQRPNGTLSVTNIGRARMLHNDLPRQTASLASGDTLQLGSQLILLCVRRSAWSLALPANFALPPFGRADHHRIVGESAAIWELRRQLVFAAAQPEHVLVSGESGTGKELLANALHALSSRGGRALVSRNASTFPDTLIDAELFGNAKNYPNPGTPERPGLLGHASDSTLFLDELAELPQGLQTHLLRVLDAGEYQRLGETNVRRANLRLIGATNQPGRLRTDLAARFKIRIHSPGLDERREDIPLLVHAAMRSIAAQPSADARRFFPDEDIHGEPRVSRALMWTLLNRQYVAHFRELETLLWKSVNQSLGDTLEPVKDAERTALASTPPDPQETSPAVDPATLSRHAVQSALERNDWVVEQAYRELGLSSRHVLTRLMTRHGLRRP
jgi:DNA-binding NtrC family response regulator